MAANIHGACRANAAVFVIYCMCPRVLRIKYRHTAFVHNIFSMSLCLLRIVCIWNLRIDYYLHTAFMHHIIVSMPLCLYYVLYVWHLRIDYRHTAFMHHIVSSMPLCLRIVCIWHLRVDYRHTAFTHHIIVSMPLCIIH